MGRLFHKALTLLLTTAVLTGSLLPPALSHAHAEGDRPHSQRSEAVINDDHAHSHHTEKHDHADHSEQDRGESMPPFLVGGTKESSIHLHVFVFGIDFSIPMPHRDGSDDPLTPDDGGHIEYVRLTTDVVLASRVDLSVAVDVAAAASVFPDRHDAALSLTARFGIRTVDRILLCDGARFERSGVLLI